MPISADACSSFPGLARNTPEIRQKVHEYRIGKITREEYDIADSMKRNELSNLALYVSGIGEIIICAFIIAILHGIHSNRSAEQNNWGLSVAVAFGSAAWLMVALPWFFLEKRRPSQPIPPGKNVLTAGLWQMRRGATQIWKLKTSLAYLIGKTPLSSRRGWNSQTNNIQGYFFLGDSLNTTVTLVQTLQNTVQQYNIIQLALLLMTGLAAQTCGVYTFWFCQRRRNIDTKTMFNIVAVAIILLDCWGMLGIWTGKVGFHHPWEFWM